jgi:hypothetical protein
MGYGEGHGMLMGLSGREWRWESMIGGRVAGLQNSLRPWVVIGGNGWCWCWAQMGHGDQGSGMGRVVKYQTELIG